MPRTEPTLDFSSKIFVSCVRLMGPSSILYYLLAIVVSGISVVVVVVVLPYSDVFSRRCSSFFSTGLSSLCVTHFPVGTLFLLFHIFRFLFA